MYLQFNNTTTVYLQCCWLPMLQAPNNAAGSLCCSRLPTSGDTARGSLCCSRLPLCCSLTTMQHAPYAAAGSQQVAIPYEAPYAPRGSLYAARLQQCSMLPMLLDYNNATCSLCCTSSSMLQPANMWRYRTASGSQRQCCCLASGSLYAAPMLPSLALYCRLPTVAIPHCKWLPTAMLHEAPSKLRLPTCGSLYAAPMSLAVKLPAVNCPPKKLPAVLAACRLTAPYIQLQSGHAFTAGSLAQSSRSPPGDS
jgi:hypothetical protein